jgi:hypothetical protein
METPLLTPVTRLDQPYSHTVAVFAVRPVKVHAHAKGDPFGATRHTFSSTDTR